MAKFVFVTGGVMSGIGKGVIAASIGKIGQVRGLRVTSVKIDPYLNYDAGTMNPYIHGEVFVTEDGGETDMDIETYERFLDINVPKSHNITTGQVYSSVIERERRGGLAGDDIADIVLPLIAQWRSAGGGDGKIHRRVLIRIQIVGLDLGNSGSDAGG